MPTTTGPDRQPPSRAEPRADAAGAAWGLPARSAGGGRGGPGRRRRRRGGGYAVGVGTGPPAVAEPPGPGRYPFYGTHQAGIATPAQDRLHFAAFDVIDRARATSSSRCCRTGPTAAARMTQGQGAGESRPDLGTVRCAARRHR